MGAVKNLFMERPETLEREEFEDLFGHHFEPDFPDTWECMTEPLEGTCFDPDNWVPF